MRKKLLFTFLLLLTCFSIAKAETVQVGSGSSTNLPVPFNPGFYSSYTQQIYQPSEIGKTGTITSIAFYAVNTVDETNPAQTRNLDLFLVETDKSSFSSDTDWLSISESNRVFSGEVTFPVGCWTTITFDTPFEYNGTGNLCVIVYDKTGVSTHEGGIYWLVYQKSDYYTLSWIAISSSETVDLASPPTTSFTNRHTFNNQLQLTFADGGGSDTNGTIQVGSGLTTQDGLPFPSNWKYSYSEQIYTIAEIGKTGTITSLAFKAGVGFGQASNIDLYLVKTSKSSFSSETDFVTASESDKVFSGSVTFNADEWTTLTFDTPFEYDGTTNLCVIVNNKTGSYSDMGDFYVYNATNQSLVRYNDNSGPYNPASPGDTDSKADPSFREFKCQLQLTFADGSGGTISAPASADFETGDFSQIAFENDATYPWIVTSDDAASGTYCMKSGNSGQNSTSSAISVTVNYASDGHITFDAKCMGEGANTVWDKCIFYIDDVAQFTYGAKGDTWDNYGYNVTAGNHTFKWEYTKDSSISATGDAFFVDNIEFGLGTLILPPTNLAVTDIQWNSATVTWESGASAFNLQYKEVNSSEWTTVSSITATSYTLTELQEQTTYDVRVQAEGGDTWISTTFTTSARFPRPTDIQVLAVTPYTAAIDWTDNCGASAWQVAVNTWDNITDVTRKPFILTGLTPGTENAFAVRAVIEVDGETLYSPWSEAGFFTTPVPNPLPEISSVIPTPNSATITWEGQSDSYKVRYRNSSSNATFFEDFESSEGSLPAGWTIIDADGDGHNWEMAWDGETPHFTQYEGHYCIVSGSYDKDTSTPLTPDNWLITPKVTLGSGASAWLRGQDDGYSAEHFAFYVSTTDTDPSSFTKVSNEYVSTNEYREYTADLSAYAGQQGYVAIRHYNVTDMFYLNVDNFSIYNTADTEDWTVVETTEKTVTIEGLTPDTDYEFEVIGIMQGQEDASSSVYSFMTLDSNPVPFDVVIKPAATTANIRWTGYGDIYHVQYRVSEQAKVFFSESFESDMGGWTTENLHSNSGISSNTAYNGSQSFRFYYSQTPPQYIISPELSGITEEAILKFQYRINSTSYPESFMVGYSTTTNSTDAFTWSSELTYGEDTDWHEYSQAVPAGTKYIAIQCTSNDQYYLFIDDISVYSNTVIPAGEWQGVWSGEPKAVLTGLEKDTKYDFKIESYIGGVDEPAVTDIMQFTTKADIIDLVMDNNEDNRSTISSHAGDCANVTIQNLTLESGKWQGICLPFDVDVENSPLAGADVRTMESETSIDGKLFLNFLTPVTEMKAGTPYIVKMESDLSNPVFENVTIRSNQYYVELENSVFFNALYYYFTSDEDQTQFFKMIGSTGTDLQLILKGDNLQAFESYIKVNYPANYDEIFLNTGEYNDMITGLSSVKGTEEEVIYNLAGQRLGKKQRGFNIVNGKKMVLK